MVSKPDPQQSRSVEFQNLVGDFEHALGRIRHHIGLFGRPEESEHHELDAALAARYMKIPDAVDHVLTASIYPLTACDLIAELTRQQLVATPPSEQRIRETFSKCRQARGWVRVSDRGATRYTTSARAAERGLASAGPAVVAPGVRTAADEGDQS